MNDVIHTLDGNVMLRIVGMTDKELKDYQKALKKQFKQVVGALQLIEKETKRRK